MLEQSQAIVAQLSDAELERFAEFLQRVIELQQRHTERVRAL